MNLSKLRTFALLFSFALAFGGAFMLGSTDARAQSAGSARDYGNDDGNSNSGDDNSARRNFDDGMKKINDQMKCRNRCQRESFSCMGGCPSGNNGMSCRANCQLESSNCSQNCD
jgi:hypothetical protein